VWIAGRPEVRIGPSRARQRFTTVTAMQGRATVARHRSTRQRLVGEELGANKASENGGRWSHEKETTAKYVAGEEAVRILAERGITAVCDADC
jgi:hypothetical protein